jgi:cell division protein FtsL
MSRLEVDYDLKRDVRNNPIVREIDRVRQRELWRSGAVGVSLVAVLLFSAWQHFELLRHGYGIEQLEQDRALEIELNRHLRLEIETLRSLRRVEQIAIEELNLVAPTPAEVQVIERIALAALPDGSVMVSRDSAPPAGQRP